jgi:hypothetical protein
MEKSDKAFDPAESIILIRRMIESTKNSMSDGSHYFLLWGWATMLACLTQFFLMDVLNYKHHYNAWLIIPVALLIHVLFIVRDKKHQKVKTFIGDANAYLWTAVGCSFFVLAIIFANIGWQYSFPFYILFYGLGTSVSGALLRFRPLLYGGISCFVLAALASYLPYPHQILLAGFAILISYIIPGHLLRSRFKQRHRMGMA